MCLSVCNVFVYSCQVGFSWFQVGFHGFSWFQFGFSLFFMAFHGSRLVFMVFHGSRLVFMVFLQNIPAMAPGRFSRFQVGFHGFSWFQVDFS